MHPPTVLPREIAGIRLPDSPLAQKAVDLAFLVSPVVVRTHVVRTFVFGSLVGKAQDLRYDEELCAMEIARGICKCAPLGLRATKKAGLVYLQQGERAAVEAIPSIEKAVFGTEDFKEGLQSFIERREARFEGR
jgi:enoyl-CoA hydratase/carnithine racemase